MLPPADAVVGGDSPAPERARPRFVYVEVSTVKIEWGGFRKQKDIRRRIRLLRSMSPYTTPTPSHIRQARRRSSHGSRQWGPWRVRGVRTKLKAAPEQAGPSFTAGYRGGWVI